MGESLPASVALTAYHGDTWTQTFRLKQGTAPVDLTGASVAAWAQALNGQIQYLAATIVNGPAGELQIGVGPDGLPAGSYTYDVELVQQGVVTTWIRGALSVTQDITNPVL